MDAFDAKASTFRSTRPNNNAGDWSEALLVRVPNVCDWMEEPSKLRVF